MGHDLTCSRHVSAKWGAARLSRVLTERDEVRSYDARRGPVSVASDGRVEALTIDITFDFRTDASGKNPEPDASSPTLLRYHHLLWSKSLPSGKHSNSAHGTGSRTPYFTTPSWASSC